MISVLSPSPALDISYLLDEVVVGGIHRPREVLRLGGGKGLNLARAAGTLGEQVRVVAPLGGHVGALVAQLAREAGLQLDAVPVAAETRSCVSAIPDLGAATEFYETAAPLSVPELNSLLERFVALPDLGWSVLAGRLPETTGWADALLARRARGDQVAIDASGVGLATLVADVHPDLLKVNRTEAAELLEGSVLTPLGELVSGLRDLTGGIVVVTDGAAGAEGADATGSWRALPDPEPGRFAIGSGDSFFAGLLVALGAGAALDDALRIASAAGSANTRVPGAGVFEPAAYDAARTRIRVEPA
jgi:fructose-1-phosphate kinase PfkB-like protein